MVLYVPDKEIICCAGLPVSPEQKDFLAAILLAFAILGSLLIPWIITDGKDTASELSLW